MGMFDYITCNYPLPKPEHQGMLFQTKCIQEFPDLAVFHISEKGELLCGEERVNEDVTPDEINFYGFEDESRFRGWIEYRAILKDKMVSEIEIVENSFD